MLHPVNIHWFEIPVADIDRAQRFYEGILAVALRRESFEGREMAEFPHDEAIHATGALVAGAGCTPSAEGSTIYLSVADVARVLEAATLQGAEILVPRTVLPADIGAIAQFRDSEGNRIGLWSRH